MEEITTLKAAWIFDHKGNVKQLKNQTDRPRAQQIYHRAKEALRYTKNIGCHTKFQRLSFISGKLEWTITINADKQIIVMQKDQSLL